MTTTASDLPSRKRRQRFGKGQSQRRAGTLRLCTYVLGILIACDAALQFYLTWEPAVDKEPLRMFDALPDLETLVTMSSSLSFSWDGTGSSHGRDPQGAGPALVFTPVSSRSYELNLNSRPSDQVAITLRDEESCFKSFVPRALVFSPQNWASPRLIQVQEDTAKFLAGCSSHVLHEVFSTDQAYHGLHVRTQPLAGFRPISDIGAGLSPAGDARSNDAVGSMSDNAPRSENLEPSADGAAAATVTEQQEDGSAVQQSKDLDSESADKASALANSASSSSSLRSEAMDVPSSPPTVTGIPPIEVYTSDTDLSAMLREHRCVRTALSNGAIKCEFAIDTPWASSFYIISAPALQDDLSVPAPMALIVSGVHGKEFAGFGAGGTIKTWQPAQGRLIVIDRMNARGIDKRTRYVPRFSKMSSHLATASASTGPQPHHDDLNRDFPADVSVLPDKVLPAHIWDLVTKLKPKLFLDLHEGWGYYAQLKSHEAKEPNVLVGNPRFSKGSSVIATENSLDLAQIMVDAVNVNVKERLHRFEVLSPPISGGLARRIHNAFGAQSFVLETTQQNQALEKRVSQHLHMVAAALQRIGFLDLTFKPAKVVKARKTAAQAAAAFSGLGAASGGPSSAQHPHKR
ncbi:Hypothetical Protein FCC1311_024832 [Hondaea fermentalgiana]|uniref:Uncharacterized protein n=1 Tax=Hondaea fermentalgiana TaxID=2315210 RepID=A0A2R5G5E1_9STRA|nr:Hypothetical Protein FCC1311_024832 [Hondaea fermentalgiana]|eukprot:GBG26262.1 Hypothetical Protein FCC1311_024832 [Hondaea fermentalgiana]